jgi:hypothetical protein
VTGLTAMITIGFLTVNPCFMVVAGVP